MAKKGVPNMCYHEAAQAILSELNSPLNISRLREQLRNNGHAIGHTALRGYLYDFIEMGLADLPYTKPRGKKRKFKKPRESWTLQELRKANPEYFVTTEKGRKFVKDYEELEKVLVIPAEDDYASSFPVQLEDGREGEFPLTAANLAIVEAKLGKDRSKWIGHNFSAEVVPFKDRKTKAEYLGWAIIADSVK